MRYALGIEYDGSAFCGWQRQSHAPSVQQSTEKAVSLVADRPTVVICAGRTDSGVHSRGQVVHFDTQSERTERQWLLGINSNLPPAARVLWIRMVDEKFHARFGAYSRSYRYSILNRPVRPAIGASYFGWCRDELDTARMHEAAQVLLGKHDFSAFRSSGCSAQHAIREVSAVDVNRQKQLVRINITANAFLYHMVRNIVGSLVDVGLGEKSCQWFADVFKGRDRKLAGVMADPQGLCFMHVRYDPKYGLPEPADELPLIGVDQ